MPTNAEHLADIQNRLSTLGAELELLYDQLEAIDTTDLPEAAVEQIQCCLDALEEWIPATDTLLSSYTDEDPRSYLQLIADLLDKHTSAD